MPPILSMPVFRPQRGTGYGSLHAHVRLSHPVRIVPGDTAAREGWIIELRDVADAASERDVYAMTKGFVSFGYATTQNSAPPAGGPMPPLRAMFMLADEVHCGETRGRGLHNLGRNHPETSLGKVSESFYTLTYVEYENLDFMHSRQALIALINNVIAQTSPAAAWTLNSRHRIGQRRRGGRPHVLGAWLRRDGHTVEQYVDYLFAHERLNTNAPDNVARRIIEAEGLHLNVGDNFGVMAAIDSTLRNCRIAIRFYDQATHLINPSFYVNALMKGLERVDFFDDARFVEVGGGSDNKLGVPALLSARIDPGVAMPPATLAQRIHPLIWLLARDPAHSVMMRLPTGELSPASCPPLYVASSVSAVYHLRFDDRRIDLDATGLAQFHENRRRVVGEPTDFWRDPIAAAARDSADPSILHGSRYQWRIDDAGYLVYRTNSNPPVDDAWYPPFTEDDFRKVETIWTQQAEAVNRFCLYFGIPCELFVGISAKEAGPNPSAVGLEPWIPPPPTYVNAHPWSDRALFETMPPERIHGEFMSVPGIRYMLLTHYWSLTEQKWKQKRRGMNYRRGGSLDVGFQIGETDRRGRFVAAPPEAIPEVLRGVVISYTWADLLADLDHYGHERNSGTQPPEIFRSRPSGETVIPTERYRNNKRFCNTLDQRVSPGATQNILAFVPPVSRMVSAVNAANPTEGPAFMAALRTEGFFNQEHHYLGTTRDITDPATPPSYGFLWLVQPERSAFTSFVRWSNNLHDLRTSTSLTGVLQRDHTREDSRPAFPYRLLNEPLDPIIVVALHGGLGDLARFNSVAAFGIFMVNDQARNRWYTFPPKFNACVRLFEQYERFGEGGLTLPAVRYARRRS